MSDKETAFSDHIRELESGEECDATVWEAIWNVLKAELRRKGIYSAGPDLLGYEGKSWKDEDARTPFIVDAWQRGIRSRLRGIHRNLLKTGNVEKLVKRNLRNFIGERQEQHDPAGRALFKNLKNALTHLCLGGFIARHGKSLEENWCTDDEFGALGSADQPTCTEDDIKIALEQTGIQFEGLEQLLEVREMPHPELVSAIADLAEHGSHRFSVKTLKAALISLAKASGISLTSVRERRFADSHAEFLEDLRTAEPDTGYEDEERQDAVFDQIHQMIDELPRKDVIKTRLHAVAEHFQAVLRESDGISELTVRELSEKLGTSKSTTGDDITEVRKMACHVLATSNAKAIGEHHA